MKHTTTASILTGITALALLVPTVAAARDVRLADCPEAVRTTIQGNARDGRIDEVEMVQIKGNTVYVADIDLKGGLDLNLHISPEGALIKTVEDIRLADAPEAVRNALRSLGGHVDDLDKITTGKTVTYDADIERHGQPDLDVLVSADGTELRQTEDRDDD